MATAMSKKENPFIARYLRTDLERVPHFVQEVFISKYILQSKQVPVRKVWKQIIGMRYRDFLRTPYWKAIALYVKRRDSFECQICHSKDKLHCKEDSVQLEEV